MNYNEKDNLYDMLRGAINRMCCADSEIELLQMALSAFKYVISIYDWNLRRIHEEELEELL